MIVFDRKLKFQSDFLVYKCLIYEYLVYKEEGYGFKLICQEMVEQSRKCLSFVDRLFNFEFCFFIYQLWDIR